MIIELLFTLFPWIIGFFGLIVGSFLNVLIIRWGTGQGIGGRSKCVQCHKQLSVWELFPVISFLIQKGTCRGCNKKISVQYPLVEIATAVLFFFSGKYFLGLFWNPLSIWFWAGLAMLLWMISLIMMIVVYDWKTRTIPARWIIWLVISGILFLVSYYASYQGLSFFVLQSHIVGIIIAVPFLVMYLFSQGRWMGFADIEIIAWIGLMHGFVSGISSVILSFYMGAVYVFCFVLYQMVIKKQSYQSIRKQPIAFAPFLFLGFLVTLFCNVSIISLIGKLFL